jgi:tetratricopeptide (TPR) repeat protein
MAGLIAGLNHVRRAEAAVAAQDYPAAAAAYESAAAWLFWRGDLRERAGMAALLGGRPDEAVRLLSERGALSRTGQLALATAYLRAGDPQEALAVYESVLAEHEASADVYVGLAEVQRALQDWEAERAALESLIRLTPEDAAAHYRLGLLCVRSDLDAARDHLRRAAELDPAYGPAVQALRAALNLAELQNAESERLVVLGRGLGLAAEWPLAHELFARAVELDAAHAQGWAWLGEARQQLGQDGGAELDTALQLEPDSAVVHALRGQYWFRSGAYESALAEYQAASRLEPENPAWTIALAETYEAQGSLEAALSLYRRATELGPSDAQTWRRLAQFCAEYRIAIQEAGLPAAHMAVELAPEDPLALDALGWNLYQAEYLYSAELNLLAALELDPDLAPARYHLAFVYLETGNREAAHAELLRVLALDPDGRFGRLAAQVLDEYFP